MGFVRYCSLEIIVPVASNMTLVVYAAVFLFKIDEAFVTYTILSGGKKPLTIV